MILKIRLKFFKEPDYFPDQRKNEKQDYEADFESDEYGDEIEDAEEEEPQDEATQHREAWLVEQAERGRARQRALMNRMEAGEKKNTEERLSRDDPGQRIMTIPVRKLFTMF